jgi:hypothetical protein
MNQAPKKPAEPAPVNPVRAFDLYVAEQTVVNGVPARYLKNDDDTKSSLVILDPENLLRTDDFIMVN